MRSHTPRRRPLCAALAATMLLATGAARAQGGATSGEAPAALAPPKLAKNVAPLYPESKRATGERAFVVVTLTIDAHGDVTQAVVATSGGADFDEAALAAAKGLSFAPATKDGAPIAAKIPFRFDFASEVTEKPPVAAAAESPTPPPAPKTAVLRGVARTPTEEPLPGATIVIRVGTSVIATTVTDGQGAFSISALPPGKYRVELAASGFGDYASDEELAGGTETAVVYRPSAVASGADIEVKGERPPREVTKRTLEGSEIRKIPGTNGDALRSVENLPGVGRPPGLSGVLLVRGSGPNDTAVFLDGTQIPLAYHFGGITSVVPSEMLARIDFLPGNFGPEYGGVMGGVVDIGIRSPRKEGRGGLLQFDVLDGRLLAEGAITDKTRFLVAGRRSWVDAWLGPLMKKGGADVSTAPVYYDYQAMLEHDVTSSTTARLLFWGSDDRLAVTVNTLDAGDPVGGAVNSRVHFWRLQGRLDTRVSDRIRWINTASYGLDGQVAKVGDYFGDLAWHPLQVRSDLRVKLGEGLTFVTGVDVLYETYDVTYKFPPFPGNGVAQGPLFARPANVLSGSGSIFRPGAYAMLEVTPFKGLRLLPGFRADYAQDTGKWTGDPRLAARWDVAQAPRTTFKGGVGLFHQPPQPKESITPFGQNGLSSNRAIHYSLGVEQELTRAVELSFEGFYKDLRSLVSERAAESSSRNGFSYANTGSGRVMGLEALLRYKSDGRFFGWLAYTLSKSERRDDPSQPFQTFQYDQTHILTALGSYQLGRGWEVGARFRYVTGSPYTPRSGGLVDFDAGAYAPISGAPFSARDGAFHSLDVRVEKRWDLGAVKLAAYLDVHNAYARKNPEGRSYNYDYTQSKPVAGLPLLPIIGIRGEL